MVKIRNGKTVLSVPVKAYETIYKPAGWVAITKKADKPKKNPNDEPENAVDKIPEEKSQTDTQELMNQINNLVSIEDMRAFAAEHDISGLEGITSRKALRAEIRKALNITE